MSTVTHESGGLDSNSSRIEIDSEIEKAFQHLQARNLYTFDLIELYNLPRVSWFVGPNGSGKSSILRTIESELNIPALRNYAFPNVAWINSHRVHDGLLPGDGLSISSIEQLFSTSFRNGTVTSAIALLVRDVKLRIRVLAKIQQICGRDIKLEFVKGLLSPRIANSSREVTYEFNKEATGLLELITLLTYTYCETFDVLLIDEPELSLHPQFQRLLLEELQRSKKRVIIVTHSPFMLNIRSISDLQGVICFHNDGRPPSQIRDIDDSELKRILPHLTEDKSVMFFADHPVFCEGDSDSQIIGLLYRKLRKDISLTGYPIAMGGCREVISAYRLSIHLGKRPSAVLDLDVIFDDRLFQAASLNPSFTEAMSDQSHTPVSLKKVLWDKLDAIVKSVLSANHMPLLKAKLQGLSSEVSKTKKDLKEMQRRWILLAITKKHSELEVISDQADVQQVLKTLKTILETLATVGLFVLPHGSIEHHLPSFKGDILQSISSDAKNETCQMELEWLNDDVANSIESVKLRYPQLVKIIEKLPVRQEVNLELAVREYVAKFLFTIINAISKGQLRTMDQPLESLFSRDQFREFKQMCHLTKLELTNDKDFRGNLHVQIDERGSEWMVEFDQNTNPAHQHQISMKKIEISESLV